MPRHRGPLRLLVLRRALPVPPLRLPHNLELRQLLVLPRVVGRLEAGAFLELVVVEVRGEHLVAALQVAPHRDNPG